MKNSGIVFLLFFFITSLVLGQNIEVPETVITGSDKSIYKTPIIFYPHNVQIKIPQPPEIPQEYLKQKPTQKQDEKKIIENKTKISNEFTMLAGKFGYIYSDFLFKSPDLYFSLGLLNDDSYRSHDGKKIFEIHTKKPITENLFFAIEFWNCLKEVPQPGPYRTKHTTTLHMKMDYLTENYNFSAEWKKNSLAKLEQTEGFFTLKKSSGNFTFGTMIGVDYFAEKNNRLILLSGEYKNKNMSASIALKNIGDDIRILPSLTIYTEKNNIKLQTCFSSRFDFPDLWQKVGEQPHLDMKNIFLPPEEIYSAFGEVSGKIKGTNFSIKGVLSYEKLGYHWLDIDNDNLYEPQILKDNLVNMVGITLSRNFEKFYVESGHFWYNQEKKKSGFFQNMSYISAGFDAGKLNTHLQLNHLGKQTFDEERVKPYTLLSATISYSINPETKLFCRFNNIIGEKYQIAPGYPGRPFDFIAGFQTRW